MGALRTRVAAQSSSARRTSHAQVGGCCLRARLGDGVLEWSRRSEWQRAVSSPNSAGNRPVRIPSRARRQTGACDEH
jgi:hypothetical protein